MRQFERLRSAYEANIACGDISEHEKARMLAEIAAAEARANLEPFAPSGWEY